MPESITRRGLAVLAGGAGVIAALPLRLARAAEHTSKIGTNVPASPAPTCRGVGLPSPWAIRSVWIAIALTFAGAGQRSAPRLSAVGSRPAGLPPDVSAAGRICRRASTRAGAAERAGSAFLFLRKRIGAAGLPAERAQDGADAAAPSGIATVLHPGNRWAASGTRTTMLATSLVALSPLAEALGNMKRAT